MDRRTFPWWGLCGGEEAAAGVQVGDVESPEVDIEE